MRTTYGSSHTVEKVEEKLCRKCGEHWPATTEFFYRDSRTGQLFSPCKACQAEHIAQRNAQKTCCVPGCSNPRHAPYSSRCYEHRYHQPKRRTG